MRLVVLNLRIRLCKASLGPPILAGQASKPLLNSPTLLFECGKFKNQANLAAFVLKPISWSLELNPWFHVLFKGWCIFWRANLEGGVQGRVYSSKPSRRLSGFFDLHCLLCQVSLPTQVCPSFNALLQASQLTSFVFKSNSGRRAANSSAIACQSLFLWSVSSTRWASDDMFFHWILHLLLDGVRLILYVSEKLYGEVQVALCLWFFPILVEAFLCLACISPPGASFVGI